MPNNTLVIRQLNRRDYQETWQAMKDYTDQRDELSNDEIWLVEHDPVFTQGQAGKAEHVLFPGDIPVVASDRGGQVTYHGPGQQVAYILLDIRRKKLGVRELVSHIENAIIALLADYGIESHAKPDAPGVYVYGEKVASLGLRIRRGCSFHGLALNVNMDLAPFTRINPCGYTGLNMTQTSTLNGPDTLEEAGQVLVKHLARLLDYQNIEQAGGN